MFNHEHGTTECLLELSPGRLIDKVQGNVCAVPSSAGLAQFITKQTPLGGLPYELAHSVNGNRLVPASSASNIEQRLTDLQADVRKLGSDKAADRDRMDRAVKAMTELNNSFATFGCDLTATCSGCSPT